MSAVEEVFQGATVDVLPREEANDKHMHKNRGGGRAYCSRRHKFLRGPGGMPIAAGGINF